jgi:hypothetical protein
VEDEADDLLVLDADRDHDRPHPFGKLLRQAPERGRVAVACLVVDRDPAVARRRHLAASRSSGQPRDELLHRPLDGAEIVGLHVDRAVGAPAPDRAHLEWQDEVARLLAEAEPLVEVERGRVRVHEEVCRAARTQVLDHRLDECVAGSLAAARLEDVEVADSREVILEPRCDEPDRTAVRLGQEERVRVERLLELGPVRFPAHVRPGRRLGAFRLPLLPERLERVEVGGGGVADRHAGGKRRSPVRR